MSLTIIPATEEDSLALFFYREESSLSKKELKEIEEAARTIIVRLFNLCRNSALQMIRSREFFDSQIPPEGTKACLRLYPKTGLSPRALTEIFFDLTSQTQTA